VTETIAVSTTVCPVTDVETDEPTGKPTTGSNPEPTGSKPGGGSGGGSNPSPTPGGSASEIVTTIRTLTTISKTTTVVLPRPTNGEGEGEGEGGETGPSSAVVEPTGGVVPPPIEIVTTVQPNATHTIGKPPVETAGAGRVVGSGLLMVIGAVAVMVL